MDAAAPLAGAGGLKEVITATLDVMREDGRAPEPGVQVLEPAV